MVDRNRIAKEQAQAQFARAQLRKRFMADLASGVTGAYDKEKTRLEAGQLVIWHPPPDILYWLIKDVGPALDLPQPALRVTLTITVPVILPPGQRMGNMLVIGNQEEQEPAALARDTLAGDPPTSESQPRDTPEEHADGRDTRQSKPSD